MNYLIFLKNYNKKSKNFVDVHPNTNLLKNKKEKFHKTHNN